jgi:hypothetical protein
MAPPRMREDCAVKRIITGRAAARTMTLGELRQFLASVDSVPDEALIRTRSTFRRYLRSLTIEEDDVGFGAYVRAVASSDPKETRAEGRRERVKPAEKASV